MKRQQSKKWYKESTHRYITSAKGKARNARQYAKRRNDPIRWLWEKLFKKMNEMMTNPDRESGTVFKFTEFASRDDMILHFQHQFTPGMTTSNHGRGSDKWNIGHRIARAMYDKTNEEDQRRCWSKANLFPQWETENVREGVRLPNAQALLALRGVWPVAWNDQLPNKEQCRVMERNVMKWDRGSR